MHELGVDGLAWIPEKLAKKFIRHLRHGGDIGAIHAEFERIERENPEWKTPATAGCTNLTGTVTG